jgi:hypothetical protein
LQGILENRIARQMIDLATWAFVTILCVTVAVGITLLVLFRREKKRKGNYKVRQ